MWPSPEDFPNLPFEDSILADESLDTDHMDLAMAEIGFDSSAVFLPWHETGAYDVRDDALPSLGTDQFLWRSQTAAFSSFLLAQQTVIENFSGDRLAETQLMYEAATLGWTTGPGMSLHDATKILELHGVSCHVNDRATFGDVLSELSKGRTIVLGVDTQHCDHVAPPMREFLSQAANRAIWVSSVDLSNPNNPTIGIQDSGASQAEGAIYNLNVFSENLDELSFSFLATDDQNEISPTDWIGAAIEIIPLLAEIFFNKGETSSGDAAAVTDKREIEEKRLQVNPEETVAKSGNGFAKMTENARDSILRRI